MGWRSGLALRHLRRDNDNADSHIDIHLNTRDMKPYQYVLSFEMRWFGVVLGSLLLAGSNASPMEVSRTAGGEFTFNLVSFASVASCHLTPPGKEILDFYYDKPLEHERYELLLNPSLPGCAVKLMDLEESDSGIWELALKTADEENESDIDIDIDRHLSAAFNLAVAPKDLETIDLSNFIEIPTRTGQNIDISLSKTAFPENCYVRKPGEPDVLAADANIEGVKIQSSSDFVSCRITIGPMDDSLLGDWTLCGRRTDNDEEHERCQHARITWNNKANPNIQWGSVNQAKFDHAVHLGGSLSPVVMGTGDRITCHIITPKGEDLVIGADSDYPNLKLVATDRSACSVAIDPITESMLGDWTLYGKFRDFVGGLNEIRLPMHLFLYDKENPYDQAYNVTIRDPIRRAVNLESILNVEVTSSGKVDSCQVRTPAGEMFDLDSNSYEGASLVDVEGIIACRLKIGPITEQLLGDWTVIGKFSNNGRFTELQQTYKIIKEDPTNPIIDEDRTVQYMNAQQVTTEIGKSHRLIIHSDVFTTAESCHIMTPSGLHYTIMDGFSVPGVEVIEENGIECGVNVNVLSEDAIGTWTLIARATRHSQSIERRLPFTINVEEIVDAVPKEVTIVEGYSLYVRLASPTDQYDTCKLVGPNSAEASYRSVIDPLQLDFCGYIIKNVEAADAGDWEIVYGSRKIYRAPISVTTVDASDDTNFAKSIDLVRDRSVNMTVGPANAVYCRLVDPKGYPVFDSFGKCTLTLDKVTPEHHGAWNMIVGSPGKVIAVTHQLYVYVNELEDKPIVSTHVEQAKPIVTVSCSVATDAVVHACKFRDPQGKILLAASGVSEERYVFHGTETSYQSEVKTHECGLQITNPLVSDLGIWRCAIETEEDTYYGFVDVLCPWALKDPEVAATVQQEPILRSAIELVYAVEDEPVTMSCSVEAAIKYCYFRAKNGTTFSVSPGMSSYVGAGFEAGECGVRFSGMAPKDSGSWSCHVGLVKDPNEQRAQFHLDIEEAMRVSHFYDRSGVMIVEGVLHGGRNLDYCRFVRIDGFGFTTGNIVPGYANTGSNTYGICQISIRNPTILDMHPWTVVAKIRGHDKEISKDTMDSIIIAPYNSYRGMGGFTIFLYVFMSVVLAAIIMGACLGPKKNREWTYARASSIRTSIRNSMRKPPLPPQAPISQQV